MVVAWDCWFWHLSFSRCNKHPSLCLLLRYINSHLVIVISSSSLCCWCPVVRKHVDLKNPNQLPPWLMACVCLSLCVCVLGLCLSFPQLCWWMRAVAGCLQTDRLSVLRPSSSQPPSNIYVSMHHKHFLVQMFLMQQPGWHCTFTRCSNC